MTGAVSAAPIAQTARQLPDREPDIAHPSPKDSPLSKFWVKGAIMASEGIIPNRGKPGRP
jgi:hypothetical protein